MLWKLDKHLYNRIKPTRSSLQMKLAVGGKEGTTW